jgi:hypothetical protein
VKIRGNYKLFRLLALALVVFSLAAPVAAQTDTVTMATISTDDLPDYDINAFMAIAIVFLIFASPILLTGAATRWAPVLVSSVRRMLGSATR